MKVSSYPRGFLTFTTLWASLIITTIASPALPAPTSKKLASFSDVFSGQFQVQRTGVTWLESDDKDEDGLYIEQDTTGSLVFKSIVTGESETFVDAQDVGIENIYDYYIQPDRKYVLYAANYTKQYRYTFFANYFVFNRETKETQPLVTDQAADIQYAGWAPKGDVIAFVRGNDLYVWKSGEVTRITNDGGPDTFNAVPDWVYEEEIFGDTKTLWFSPDAEYIAFLRFDETGVPTYTIPYYLASQATAPPYPEELELRYPKVGEKNPTVTFHLLSLAEGATPEKIAIDTFGPEDLVVTEVAWIAEEHENVLVRTRNRYQDLEKVVVIDVESLTPEVVRERDGTDGWLEPTQNVQFITRQASPSYIDTSDESGYNHIYLHTVDGSRAPVALTSGNWEVTAVLKVDAGRKLVYFLSTERHSTERHLYSVTFDGNKTALVDTKKEGYYAASFSTGGGYYILSYNGPSLPWQKLYSIESSTKELQTINDNATLKAKLQAYTLPTQSWSTLKNPEGYTLNIIEYRPPNFNPRKKYPVLFAPYGGPGAQETGKTFRSTVDWKNYLASDPDLQYIIVIVDGRGTGYQGRKHSSAVTANLGKYEAIDQVFVAKKWKQKSYVDGNHIAIWGWSFGGYLSGKTAELDSGVFTFAALTAPVSDWRFYDTLYTERYMKSLTNNLAGYQETAIAKAGGFKNIKGGFLIQHGTGDDNVHFQNTAVLVDKLLQEGVKPNKMASTFFPDSDHSINFHGANQFLYRQLAGALYEEKVRKEGVLKHQWDLRDLRV